MPHGDKPNDGGQAFPMDSPNVSDIHYGMTYRMWLAGQAMQGFLAATPMGEMSANDMVAELSVAYADALIKELDL